MDDKHQYFDGKMFTRDEGTGYYLCSTKSVDGIRKRMHVYVWEYYNGNVPTGYHVHHKDEDKSNNDISNLELKVGVEHLSFHAKENAERNHDKVIQNLLEKAIPKAKEWHGSDVGHEWHKKHYEKTKDRLHSEKEFVCENCGKPFKSTQYCSRFCSNNCKTAWRRKTGVDDVIKICADCGGEYTANKYAQTKYCSLCRNKKHSRNRKRRCL